MSIDNDYTELKTQSFKKTLQLQFKNISKGTFIYRGSTQLYTIRKFIEQNFDVLIAYVTFRKQKSLNDVNRRPLNMLCTTMEFPLSLWDMLCNDYTTSMSRENEYRYFNNYRVLSKEMVIISILDFCFKQSRTFFMIDRISDWIMNHVDEKNKTNQVWQYLIDFAKKLDDAIDNIRIRDDDRLEYKFVKEVIKPLFIVSFYSGISPDYGFFATDVDTAMIYSKTRSRIGIDYDPSYNFIYVVYKEIENLLVISDRETIIQLCMHPSSPFRQKTAYTKDVLSLYGLTQNGLRSEMIGMLKSSLLGIDKSHFRRNFLKDTELVKRYDNMLIYFNRLLRRKDGEKNEEFPAKDWDWMKHFEYDIISPRALFLISTQYWTVEQGLRGPLDKEKYGRLSKYTVDALLLHTLKESKISTGWYSEADAPCIFMDNTFPAEACIYYPEKHLYCVRNNDSSFEEKNKIKQYIDQLRVVPELSDEALTKKDSSIDKWCPKGTDIEPTNLIPDYEYEWITESSDSSDDSSDVEFCINPTSINTLINNNNNRKDSSGNILCDRKSSIIVIWTSDIIPDKTIMKYCDQMDSIARIFGKRVYQLISPYKIHSGEYDVGCGRPTMIRYGKYVIVHPDLLKHCPWLPGKINTLHRKTDYSKFNTINDFVLEPSMKNDGDAFILQTNLNNVSRMNNIIQILTYRPYDEDMKDPDTVPYKTYGNQFTDSFIPARKGDEIVCHCSLDKSIVYIIDDCILRSPSIYLNE